ncbi:WD40/YVTN/BNR-like repeat-containing protein [Kribbella solani]|uniref:Exo-alpha-sialidase n=1 Tax=Kribbella solani TaxID=236067 RepID=A0A841E3V9_9ACTN|nr:sialidase family protein [Kribbella solani]MBB5983736.1 hypothetical protein [Kribbella solani]
MSELKELSWEIQETVQPVPFEVLERRGIRRRHRRQALTGAGVVVAVAIAVLAAVLPLRNVIGSEKPPAGPPASIQVDPTAEKLIGGKKSGAAGIVYATPTRWAAVWVSPGPKYTSLSAAVLVRDGVRATAPVRQNGYGVVRVGDEVLAMSSPTSMKGTDPTWAQSVLVRLTAQGRTEKRMRWAPPTTEFDAGDVLVASSTLRALNPETGVLREVKVPGIDTVYQVDRDNTGRVWLVGGKSSGVGNIYWTDDQGKTWNHSVISPGRISGKLAVSPDGKTLLAVPGWKPSAGPREPVPIRLSTDGGEHWTTVANRDNTYVSALVAFDNGTGLVLYQGKKRELLRPGAGTPLTPPTDLGDLQSLGEFVYGMQYNGDNVITSTDQGRTWKYFVPQ